MEIKKFRTNKKLSQAELAQKVGVDRTAVVKWETGKASPASDKLPKLAKLLGCTIEELFGKE